MAESQEGFLTSIDVDQLKQRIRELEAEAARLRARLDGATEPGEDAASAMGGGYARNRPSSSQYKQVAEILDASADAIITVDMLGTVRRFNRGAEAVFGYRSAEVIGRPLDILLPDRFRKSHRSHIAHFGQSRDSSRLMNERGEIYGLRKDGVEFPAEASIVKLDSGGRATFTVILRDITERKEAQAAIHEREAQLRQAQKMAGIGTFIWDEITDGFEYCSEELAALLGYSVDAILKESQSANWVLDRIHPDDRDRYVAIVDGARETGAPYDVEFRFLHNDGHLIHLREMGEPEFDADGKVVRTFCTEQDITHIRQAEETLRQSEALLSQSQRLARLGVYVWDNVTNMCVYCSDDMAALFDMKPSQFMAGLGTEQGYLAAVHEEDREQLRNLMNKAMHVAEPYDVEYRIRDREGQWRYFHEITEPVFDHEGRNTRTFGTVQDITGLRKTQEALRQSEEQFRSLIEGSIQGVLIHQDFRPVFVNQALADIFGYDSPEEIKALGSTLPLIAEEERDRLKSVAKQRNEHGPAPAQFEFLGVRKDGSRVWLENRGNLVQWGDETAILAVMVDVTDRKIAEEALRQREEQLRAITDNIPAFIVYVDQDRRYRFVNRLAEEWYARPAEELLGQQVKDVVGDEAFAQMESRMRTVLSGTSTRLEEVRLFPDGVKRHVDMSHVPDIDADGKVRGYFSLLLDTSGRRRAETALRRTMRSADLLRQIATAANEAESAEQALSQCLETIGRHGNWHIADAYISAEDGSGDMVPAGLWWTDDPDEFAAFRASSENTSFAPGKGLPGRVAVSGLPAWIEDIAADGNFPRALMSGGEDVASGFAFPVLVGQKVAAVLEFFSRGPRQKDTDLMDIATQAGTILGRVIERQRAERALRDSEEQIRLMTDNIPVLITYVDQDKIFRFANGTAGRWYARRADEIIDCPVGELFGEADFRKMEPHLDRALAGETVHLQEVLKYPDGKIRNIDVTYVPHFAGKEEVRGIFTMVVDITDRIHAEEQLRHGQRMEAVGKLTAGVAHDFNNLLAVIMGNSEIVRDQLGRDNPVVHAIATAAERGSELTRRLLAFSRQQPLRPRATDLDRLSSDMARILARTLGETIEIDAKATPGLWRAQVDSGELENAILNLAINARDAMPEGGRLTIAAENVTLTARQASRFDNAEPGKYVRLSMADTGTGMPPDVLRHAFEPFFTTKAFGDGSGLGLSMVYGFATQSGGFPTIESLPGKGTTVSLYLPCAEASETPEGDCRPLCQPSAQGNTILVVEDDPDVRKLTVTLLKAMGYNVLESENGEDALVLIAQNRNIELLLSDVVLTGELSGPAVAAEALKDRPDLRVLFMSGYAEDVIRRDREGTGRLVDADLLAKPFTRAQLSEKVEAALQVDID